MSVTSPPARIQLKLWHPVRGRERERREAGERRENGSGRDGAHNLRLFAGRARVLADGILHSRRETEREFVVVNGNVSRETAANALSVSAPLTLPYPPYPF